MEEKRSTGDFSSGYARAVSSYSRGVTLIDTIVGSALMLIVFIGIAAAFKLSVDVVTNNRAQAGAVALANERMEYIRSLPYASVGTVGGIPAGSIPQSESAALNNISYTRRTFIAYVDDPKDGLGAADQNGVTTDYKAARVDISWDSRTGVRHITLVARVSPSSGVETACPPSSPCGTLVVNVLNALSQSVQNAQVHIVNLGVTPTVDISTYTNADGLVTLPGAPAASGYSVTATKTGYSTDQTYIADAQNTNPSPGPLTVADGQTTSGTFRIDLLGAKTIYTATQMLSGSWSEAMSDATKIASSTNIAVAGGSAKLAGTPGSYPAWGELLGAAVSPSSVVRWKTLSITDSQLPQTGITYHLYDGAGTTLIPDAQLPGNSTGLATSSSSVDLTGISPSAYPSLRLDATFTSSNSAQTPSLDSYAISYDYGAQPLPNISLTMRGAKTIGSGPDGTIYKYNANLNSGSGAMIALSNMEWDTYLISDNGGATGYDIASSCNPQPETLDPGANATTRLYFAAHTANSLLVDVSSAGALIPDASVRLYRSGYDTTKTADSCGQAFFSGLSATTYSISVSAPGHQTYTNGNTIVSGASRLSVVLN